MKKLLMMVTVVVAVAACAFALVACGSSQEMQKIDMGDYTFEVPAEWGELQQTYPDMEMYWIGGDEDHPLLMTNRDALDPEDGTPAEATQAVLDMWFNDTDTTKHIDAVDFTVGDLPARASLVDFGSGNAEYLIMFSPDGRDYVEFNVALDSPEDADGIAVAKAIQDSIALPEL